jgi:16S rRNA (cytosine967-C5)-methyltransferase
MSPSAAAAVSPARAAAHGALLRVHMASEHMDASAEGLPELEGLDARDRALAFELITGVVKRRNSLDAVLNHFSRSPLKRADPAVVEALRLGAFQMLYLDRVPVHAAVSESVELVAGESQATRGYVNAVLRHVAADGAALLAERSAGESIAALALRYSHPDWIVKLMIDELGRKEAERLLAADNLPGERCLRVNPGHDEAEVASVLAADGIVTRPSPLAQGALLYEGAPVQASRAFAEGVVTPQSQGSQLVGLVAVSGAPSATSVADLCAAPGTKTAQIALALPQARVYALDSDPRRIGELRANLERQHVTNAEVVLGDALEPLPGGERRFDSVLVDAPCTGLGTLASRPDLRWRRKPADVARLATLQAALLRRAAVLVAPGGVVTYAVCTITRAETLGVLTRVLGDGGWELDNLGCEYPAVQDTRQGACLLTLPSRHGTSGFFIARLRRVSDNR